MVRRYDPGYDGSDSQHPCSRQPPELCDGARMVVQDNGTSRRGPALIQGGAFCEACRARIVACLDDLPEAYVRLAERIGDPLRAGKAVRVPPGSRVLVNPDIDALMRVMAAVLGGWATRVRHVPGLDLDDPGLPVDSAPAVEAACEVLAVHATPLLALPQQWTYRTFTFLPAAERPPESICRHCGYRITPGTGPERRDIHGRMRWWLAGKASAPVAACAHEPDPARTAAGPDVIPAELLALLGDREIIRQGDGWLTVLDELGGAVAGNEVIDFHWKARRLLGETPAWPESLDGIPCRSCESMTLERAAPPSDPKLDANHSRCPACRDEMDEDTFHQWAETYAQWARGAGIRECRRCAMGNHGYCCWDQCTCALSGHAAAA